MLLGNGTFGDIPQTLTSLFPFLRGKTTGGLVGDSVGIYFFLSFVEKWPSVCFELVYCRQNGWNVTKYYNYVVKY